MAAAPFPVWYSNTTGEMIIKSRQEELEEAKWQRIWADLMSKEYQDEPIRDPIGHMYSFTCDFLEIVSKSMEPEKEKTKPHSDGPAHVDESIYRIASRQREPTQRERLEFSLFSKMIFPVENHAKYQ